MHVYDEYGENDETPMFIELYCKTLMVSYAQFQQMTLISKLLNF